MTPFTISKMNIFVFGFSVSLFVALLWNRPASHLSPLAGVAETEAPLPTRRALLVGISDYANGTKQADHWKSLNTAPDLENMRHVLETYYDFKGAGVRTIQNEGATQDNIIREFNQHLISTAKPGDRIVFYYTGHGFHVPDTSGDEKADGEDEVIVTWVPKEKQSLPDKERRAVMYMLDDTIEKLLRDLSRKMRGQGGNVEGSVTVIFDSCNSGSATKALLAPKGRSWKDEIDGLRPTVSGVFDVASGWLTHGAGQFEGVTFIAGSQSNQFSYMMPDSDIKGSILTHYISEFLTGMAGKKTGRKITYKDMHDYLSAKVLVMGNAQNPQVEGNINAEIFGDGQPIIEQSAPKALRVFSDPARLELNVGFLHGVSLGSRFDIYRNSGDVKNPANKLAELSLIEIRSTTSVGEIVNPISPATKPSDYEAAQAIATELRFDGKPLKVFIQKSVTLDQDTKAKEKVLSDAVASQAFIISNGVTEDSFDVTLGWCVGDEDDWCKNNKDAFFYRRANGKITSLGSKIDPASLRSKLLADWRRRFLTDLTLTGIPKVRIDIMDKNGFPIKRDPGGKIVLKPGDEGKIYITNNTGRDMFITLIHLQDSGDIYVWPKPDKVNGQEPLSADKKVAHVYDLTDITAPGGVEVEVLKIIATPLPADFTGLSYTETERKGLKSRGPWNPLEALFLDFIDSRAKGAGIKPVNVDNWYTDQITYEIRPR